MNEESSCSPSSASKPNDEKGVHLHPEGYPTRKPRFARRRKTTTIHRRTTARIVTPDDRARAAVGDATSNTSGSGAVSQGAAAAWLDEDEDRQHHQHQHHGEEEHDERRETLSSVSFSCGIAAGVLQAGLFNPFDRALYLSITNQVPFLRPENFQHPYSGFMQSVGHRALSSGLYYPLENFFCSLLLKSEDDHHNHHHETATTNTTTTTTTTTAAAAAAHNSEASATVHLHPAFANFLAGTLAGSTNALIVNPITAIKYKSWGREVNRGMLTESMEMFRKGGFRPFGNGLAPTMLRDLFFGGTYTFLRLELQYLLQLRTDQQWAANMASAAMATIVSAPFNLVRNVQYATRSREKADTISNILRDFVEEAARQPTTWRRARYVQNRLRIGWGTVRVAVGMAFGHLVYDNLMGLYEDFDDQQRTLERRRNELTRILENDDDEP